MENRQAIPADSALNLLLCAAFTKQQSHRLAIHGVLRFQLTNRERRRGGFSQGSAPRISILGPYCPGLFGSASLGGHGGEPAEVRIPEDVIETARNI